MTVQSGSSKLLKGSTGDWEVVIGMKDPKVQAVLFNQRARTG